jgi:hypothetical protein
MPGSATVIGERTPSECCSTATGAWLCQYSLKGGICYHGTVSGAKLVHEHGSTYLSPEHEPEPEPEPEPKPEPCS